MDYLFSPWRYTYVTRPKAETRCVFCGLAAEDRQADPSNLILFRGEHHYVVLNRYPYTSGHLMIVPYRHVERLSQLDDASRGEMMELLARGERALERGYSPQGINIGLNLGECAGAGIAHHLHVHAVPRWFGDTNFMTVTGETRVQPETLEDTWQRLHAAFEANP